MASVIKRNDSPYWRAQVRRRGYEPLSRTFDTKVQAEAWARHVENEMDRGVFVDRSEAERTTLADALQRYEREIVPTKRHPAQERQRIARWLDYPITKRALANLRGADFAEYRDARRAAGRADNTIRLELALISHVFEIARKEWRMAFFSIAFFSKTEKSMEQCSGCGRPSSITGSACAAQSDCETAWTPADVQAGSAVKRRHAASAVRRAPLSTERWKSSLGVGRKAWEVTRPS